MLLICLLGSAPVLQAQGTPATMLQPKPQPNPATRVTLDMEESAGKTVKSKPDAKPKEVKSEKKKAKPKTSSNIGASRNMSFTTNWWPSC